MQAKISTLIQGDKFPNFHTTSSLIECQQSDVRILHDPGYVYDWKKLRLSLENKGLAVNDITHLVLSHWHIDHCGNVANFPKAKLIVSQDTVDSIRITVEGILIAEKSGNPVQCLVDFFQSQLSKTDLIDELDGNHSRMRAFGNMVYRNSGDWKEILRKVDLGEVCIIEDETSCTDSPNISFSKVSAHTKGDLIMTVTSFDEVYTFCGDIIPYLQETLVFPMLTENKGAYRKAIEKLVALKSIIVPGHGESFSSDVIVQYLQETF